MLVLREAVTAQSLFEPIGPRGIRAHHFDRFRLRLMRIVTSGHFTDTSIHLPVKVSRPTVCNGGRDQ